MDMPLPTEEHTWLQRFVGEWTMEGQCTGPDGEQATTRGRETVKPIGGFWVQAMGEGEMPGGGDATMVLTLGYNGRTGRYVGTWLGSMMSELWVYDITREPGTDTLTMAVEGPSMSGEGTARYRDVITWDGLDRRTLTSYAEGPEGTWTPFMTAHYQRTK